MQKERRGSNSINLPKDKIYLSSDKFFNELENIYDNQFCRAFNDILNISKKDFFNSVTSKVKYLLNEQYVIEKNNSDKIQTSIDSYYKEYEEIYNIFYEELNEFLNNYKQNKNNGYKDDYVTNFTKHCWKTGIHAMHNCHQKNKKGYFLPIYSSKKTRQGNSHLQNNNNINNKKDKEPKTIKYLLCPDCKKVYFNDKFLNYCSYCDIDYYSSINEKDKNSVLLPAMWENNHCEFIINETIKCPLCLGICYIDIKYNILKCLKCKYYKSPKNIERICNICKLKFVSDIFIYNPLEKDLLNELINNSIIGKKLAHPSNVPCCYINNINSTEFYHNDNCRGILYFTEFHKKRIIFCIKCKEIIIYNKCVWNCPSCGNKFLDDKLQSKNINLLLKNNVDSSIKNIYNRSSYNIRDLEDQKKIIYNNSSIINKNHESSRKNNYEKYLLNNNINNQYLKNEKKSDINLIKDKKKNNNKNINIKIYNLNNLNNLNNKNDIKVKFKNTEIIETNNKRNLNQRDQRDSYRKTEHNEMNYRNHINNIYINQRDSSHINKEQNEIYYNKSEAHLFENKIKKEDLNSTKSIMQKYKRNIPIHSERIKSSNKTNNENNKSNEKYKNNNKLNDLLMNHNHTKEEEKINYILRNRRNHSKNNQNLKNSSSSNLYTPNQLDETKSQTNNKKKEEKISKRNYIQAKRHSKEININPFNQNTSPKSKIKNYLLTTKLNTNENKNQSRQKEKEHIKNKIKDIKIETINKMNIKEKGKKEKVKNKNIKDKDIIEKEKKKENDKIKKEDKIQKEKIKERPVRSPDPQQMKKRPKPRPLPLSPYSPKIIEHSESMTKIKLNIDLTKLKSNELKIIETSNSVSEFKLARKNKYLKKKEELKRKINEKEKLLKDIEKAKKELINNKPGDIIEHRKIDYRKDIIIEDPYLQSHPDLYDKMQKNLKQMIYRSHLPLFNPDLYKIEKKIGEGTNGAIFQVISMENKKRYAMKKLIANNLIALKYLIKEFDLVYDVVHPNILSIYGMNIKCFDINTFSLCVLMDIGETDWDVEISEHLATHKYYNEQELISILKQLTSALLYLQREKKIAHRDIKPENVLIFKNNIYKLGDFGEAKGTKDNNKLNTLRGTDIYMSPILYKGLQLSKEDVVHNLYKSDVFSLGYSFLYAASLNHDIINEIRDLDDPEEIKNVLFKMMKPRYSDTFINVILKMINLDEKTRIDFVGLDKLIKEVL